MQVHKMMIDAPHYEDDDNTGNGAGSNEPGKPKTDLDKLRAFNASLR
ncbi:hypothetical protein [Parapedobacter indicus]|nr:hypothetical protein [Parapedobacter indicus]